MISSTSFPPVTVMNDPIDEAFINRRLPRRMIIRHKDAFERMFQNGRRRNGRFVQLIIVPQDSAKASDLMVAFVCGKRIGHAVQRNLYKRRLREIFRKNKFHFRGWHILLIAFPAIRHAKFEELEADVLRAAEGFRL